MRRPVITGLLLLLTVNIFGQINMADSTVQVIGYWDKNEKQSYLVTLEKFKILETDTTSREFWKYEVDISIVDSTADSYTIDWYYHDYNIETDNELLQKISSIAEDMTVTIKTDEMGAVKEVVNWEEIKAYIYTGTAMLRKELKDIPNMDKFITQMEEMYASKEIIEAAATKDIQQFYMFHGGKYKFKEEITASIKSPNLYGGEQFDTELLLWLDEINPDDNHSLIRMKQTINSEQLTKTTFDYLTKVAATMDVPPPDWDKFPPLKNETWILSQIHGYGWIIYSIETKEVSANNALNVEERIIELQ
jgi:hypothetical protein